MKNTNLCFRLRLLFAGMFLATSFMTQTAAFAGLTDVTSGTLLANFRADSATVSIDGSGNVLSWTAQNDNSMVLNSIGSNLSNIQFNATGMNGNGTIEVNDFSDQNQVLRGGLGLTGNISESTIFWLGYFEPGRNGSLGDSLGQYAYSYGVDAQDGSQFDFQIDDDRAEMFGGAGNATGDDISGLNGIYSLWRAEYGGPVGAGDQGQSAFANGADLNMPDNGGNYSVDSSQDLQLFGYQNSAGTSSGFNFVGNMSQLVIYDGILSAYDVATVETFLYGRLSGAVPEPGSGLLLVVVMGLGVCRRQRD